MDDIKNMDCTGSIQQTTNKETIRRYYKLFYDIDEVIESKCEHYGQCKIVYHELKKHKNDSDIEKCFPTINMIIEKTQLSKNVVNRAINELIESGTLKVQSGIKGKSNNYYFPMETENNEELFKINSIARRNNTWSDKAEETKQSKGYYKIKDNHCINNIDTATTINCAEDSTTTLEASQGIKTSS